MRKHVCRQATKWLQDGVVYLWLISNNSHQQFLHDANCPIQKRTSKLRNQQSIKDFRTTLGKREDKLEIKINKCNEEVSVTKAGVLIQLRKIYDPLGTVSPTLV